MSKLERCPVCSGADPGSEPLAPIEIERALGADAYLITCVRCGAYAIEADMIRHENPTIPEQGVAIRLSGVIRRATDEVGSLHETITWKTYSRLAESAKMSTNPDDLIDVLLVSIAARVSFLSDSTPKEPADAWVARLVLRGRRDLEDFLTSIEPLGLLHADHGEDVTFELTLDGWRRVHEIRRSRGSGRKVLIAMSFHPDLSSVKAAIESAIRAAGYEPIRVDDDHYAGGVVDRILGHIRESRFVVADFTGNRGGVYYEAGFAFGLGVPVLHLCAEECLDEQSGERLHFDVRHLNFLSWKRNELGHLTLRLRDRVVALFGRGPEQATRDDKP